MLALAEAEAALEHLKVLRAAERSGRTRAEQALRKLQTAAATATQNRGSSGAPVASASALPSTPSSAQLLQAYPLRPIGHVRSCFTTRNGTPRQPQLVSAARSVVRLAPDIPDECLHGLEQYSHAWLLYIFHDNTNLAKSLSAERAVGLKAKIQVPRLNGGKMGVFATRSPHRPSPIGLSVARVLGVQDRQLVLGGADVLDGSPVLDIKPYVPFCDALPAARAPAWVTEVAEDEPLRALGVEMPPAAALQLRRCWERVRQDSVYDAPEQFMDLVEQVLSRDIRSVHQRLHVGLLEQGGASTLDAACAQLGMPAATGSGAEDAAEQSCPGPYHVVLEGIDVSYALQEDGRAVLRGACLWERKRAS